MDRGEICGRTIVAIWRSAIIASCAGANRLSRRKQLVGEYFATVSGDDDWNPRYNIAPTQPVVTIRQGAEPTGLDLPVPLRRPQVVGNPRHQRNKENSRSRRFACWRHCSQYQ